jgi:Ni/Co efflux regulator RcnB
MKTSAILCTALAATMGFSTLASAQDTRQERREARQERREDMRERREDARERVEDRREVREDRAERREDFAERREDRAERREDFRDGRRWAPNNYGYNQSYNRGYAPRYYANTAPRFYRGGYLPYTYRQPTYHVNWRAYNGLYAPPYGYQWVQVGNDFLLIALATGLIATAVTM